MTPRTIAKLLAAGACALALSVSAQEARPLAERTAQSDLPLEGARAAMQIEWLRLVIAVHPEDKSITGNAIYHFRVSEPLDTLQLDLDPRFRISRIDTHGGSLDPDNWRNPDGLLSIDLPYTAQPGETYSLHIWYDGRPHEAINAPWEGGFVWAETEDGDPWIATAVQGEGCDLFWPCIDHSSHRIERLTLGITSPPGLVAAGNGRLTHTTRNEDGTTTSYWEARDPSNYGVTVQVGPYGVAERDYVSRFGNTIPLRFWHLYGNTEGAERLLGEMEDQIAFMEATFGPYPFADEKAGVAETPHLGMEHQTINAYGNQFRPEAYGHDWLLQHEFAHEWFANQLTHASINHMWLHEGITTWTQPLYLEWARGEMLYDAEMWENRQRVWSRVPLVPPEGTLPDYNDRQAMWGDDIYFKGAWIMHTLRYLVGDAVIFPAVTELTYGTTNPQPGAIRPINRTTDDFRAILEEMTGDDLEWFFDTYFYRAPLPRLVESMEGSTLVLEWETESPLPFTMPVELRVNGEVRRVEMPDGRARVELDSPNTHYLVDPANRILRYDAAVEAYQNRPR